MVPLLVEPTGIFPVQRDSKRRPEKGTVYPFSALKLEKKTEEEERERERERERDSLWRYP